VEKAAEAGYDCIALADVNTLSGAVDFWGACQRLQVRPILGVEILTDCEQVILVVEDCTGYRNLCQILSSLHLNERFDLAGQVRPHHQGLIAICHQECMVDLLKGVFLPGSLFVPPSLWAHLEPRDRAQVRPLACMEVHRLEDRDAAVTQILTAVRRLSGSPGPQEMGHSETLIPEEQWRQHFSGCPAAVENAEELSRRCEFDLLAGGPILPKVGLHGGLTADQQLARLCHRGLAMRYNPIPHEVVKRMEYELATIKANVFSDYFLVVHEIVNWAKQNGIPVDVRGSAAGSLVSHVMGFTRVCPVEHRLYFERFMNPGRTDCPDIDIDLCWRRRDEVIRFCYDRWGADHVAMVCNIQRYRRRGAIRDVGRAMGLPMPQIDRLADRPEGQGVVYQLADQLLGIPRHIGVHCGGIVITPCPVAGTAPLQWAAKGVVITQYDKDAAEAVGLIKIDLLGNRALSTVHEAVGLAHRQGAGLDIEADPDPCDAKTCQMLTCGDSLGVFQSESPGMRQLLRGLKVRTQKDLAIALSLIRPGPASGGMKAEFIQRHVHQKPFQVLHPKMERLLADTHGVMLYQEDVMRIAVELAGYTVAEADRFRSEVSKKVSALRLQAQYVEFVYGRADRVGIDRETAERIWEEILRFASYSYCKAHATVYAHIAWQTAFLKAHHAQAFYCSLFNNHHGMYPLRVYVWDAKRHGINVLAPHVNFSGVEWTLEANAIRAGLQIVRGLGVEGIRAILHARQTRPFKDLDDLRRRVSFHKGQLEALISLGACDGLGPSRPAMLDQLRFAVADPRQGLLFDPYGPPSSSPKPEFDRLDRLRAELDVTGIPFSFHPELLLKTRHTPAARLAEFLNRDVTVAGFIAAARRARTQDGRIMGFVTLEDSTGLAEISFFPDKIQVYKNLCCSGGPVWVRGKVTEHLSSITLEGTHSGQAA
jgi:DNA polymerase III alpha subunit